MKQVFKTSLDDKLEIDYEATAEINEDEFNDDELFDFDSDELENDANVIPATPKILI